MKPEKAKKCPSCGGPLEQCRANIILNELMHQVHRGGLVIQTKPVHSFRCGYQCRDCNMQLSVKQFLALSEVSLQQHATG